MRLGYRGSCRGNEGDQGEVGVETRERKAVRKACNRLK
ncbi:unnamed protein product, partial [Ascophyllum nodosum]